MANYYGKCRTNYFSVTDAKKFTEIIAASLGDNDIEAFDEKQEDGSTRFGFLCDGSIMGLPYKLVDDEPVVTFNLDDADDDLDNDTCWGLFCDALQDILPDGEAIILTEVGFEKMAYLLGYSRVITNTDIQGVDLLDKALELARNMLGNPAYETKMDY